MQPDDKQSQDVPGQLATSADASASGSITGIAIADLAPQNDAKPTKSVRWSKIDSISVSNFKAIKKLEIPLADVTVLVGPNGSGKSSALQAIHWAARAASYIAPKNTKEVISFERLDYLPSSEPLKTAHGTELKSESSSTPTSITFKHVTSSGDAAQTATIKMWAARNKGGISVHIDGGPAVTPFKQRTEFITAYIPGLAGLSERETILVQPLLRRQAASGDAGGVLRNVIFNLASRLTGEIDDSSAAQRLVRLNQLIQSVHPGVALDVKFDDREDVNIRVTFGDSHLAENKRALESAATGLLQVIQIFSYIILFRPKLLLIDEPDAHLHPDKQERLIEALELAASEFDAQIILTTHSPNIVRAASPSVKLLWVSEGRATGTDDGAIRKLLGWGGLDKKCLFFVEDEDDKAIRALLRQWPELHRQLAVCRCFGIDNLPRNALLEGLMASEGLSIKVLVHRDRDFMTEEECKAWSDRYKAPNTHTWCTQHVDVEAYFCQPAHLAKLYAVSEVTAAAWIKEAAGNVNKAKDTFFEKRKTVNLHLYKDGGSPGSQALWDAAGQQGAETVLGKKLLAALKPIVKAAGQDDTLLNALVIPKDNELAKDLKTAIKAVIAN